MQSFRSSHSHSRTATRSVVRLMGAAMLTVLIGCSAGADAVSNNVQMAITERGFEPKDFAVHVGQPVTLTITRKTNETCANEIVIDEHNVNVKLPLNVPVKVTFTPNKTGTLRYGCAMKKMLGGVITVR